MCMFIRDVEHTGDVGRRQTVAHGQLEDLPVPVVHPGRGRVHQLPDLLGVQGPPGIGVLNRLGRLGQRDRTFARAQLRQTLVAGDRVEPGGDPRRVAELADPLLRQQEGLLDHVGGGVVIAHNGPRVRVDTVGIAAVDRLQADRVPGRHRGDGGRVIQKRPIHASTLACAATRVYSRRAARWVSRPGRNGVAARSARPRTA